MVAKSKLEADRCAGFGLELANEVGIGCDLVYATDPYTMSCNLYNMLLCSNDTCSCTRR